MSASKGIRGLLGGRAAVVWIALALVAGTGVAVTPASSGAQTPGDVTGLAVVQGDGFATLSWTPVAGATDYQIERTPVNNANEPVGPATDRRSLAADPHCHPGVTDVRRRRLRPR